MRARFCHACECKCMRSCSAHAHARVLHSRLCDIAISTHDSLHERWLKRIAHQARHACCWERTGVRHKARGSGEGVRASRAMPPHETAVAQMWVGRGIERRRRVDGLEEQTKEQELQAPRQPARAREVRSKRARSHPFATSSHAAWPRSRWLCATEPRAA
eukprot:2545207-Pleurochrysis_carterae.AAC.3